MLPNQASTSTDHSFGKLARNEYAEINSKLVLGSNVINDVRILPPQLKEVKQQVQSMVRSHLKSLSRNLELGYSNFKDIAWSSTHTILAACGLEHGPEEVCPVNNPLYCNHFENATIMQRSLMKGQCSSCFDLFVRNVVREIMT
ncbi:Hypothetical predicted protein [Olea europaea subsp. europaea]|uniref:Uncharacterized protein n=1 Tax=Olea europaea subsp. europaea TaxID=158383 RepID=A0A8S0TM67_OLEEU|nr:Hypothetical predicted protein [Olea europaea subsp. europaea]